ncbi:MAG: hypothetical protein WC282_02795, partial [Bacilli bacterium]|jgi:hypothetical protein
MAGTKHRQSLKIFRKDFLSDYFQATWFVAPPLLIGLAGGILATYFVTNNKYLVLLAGIAGLFLLLMPILPLYLDVISELFKKYKGRYFEVLTDQARQAYEEIKNMNVSNEEGQKELLDLIDRLSNKKTDGEEHKDGEPTNDDDVDDQNEEK